MIFLYVRFRPGASFELKFRGGGAETPEAWNRGAEGAEGVGSGEGVSPFPSGVGSGEGVSPSPMGWGLSCPLPRKIFEVFILK